MLLPDGRVLRNPTVRELAEAVGLSTHAALPFYDLVIVGAGPAGLAAAVYGSSEGLKTLMIEREAPGGQAGTTSRIENYLGFPSGLSGADLARRALAQARRFGTEIVSSQEAATIRREDPYRTVVLDDGTELSCQAVVIATGVSYRQLDVPGREGACRRAASTTAPRRPRRCSIGTRRWASSAVATRPARRRSTCRATRRAVHLLVRGAGLEATMSAYLVEQIGELENVELHTHCSVRELRGGDHLEGATFDAPDGDLDLPLSAVFVFIGQQPRTAWLEGVDGLRQPRLHPDRDRRRADGHGWNLDREPRLLESSLPGVFAAGDVRHRSIKRIASAVGEGAMAIQLVHEYMAEL